MPTFGPAWYSVPRWRTRMLPASTASPPNFFTPRRLLWDSRPLRVLPPAFLCAISDDLRNLDFGEELPVVLHPQVMLAAAELDDRHLVALAVAFDGAGHFRAREQRRADLDIA